MGNTLTLRRRDMLAAGALATLTAGRASAAEDTFVETAQGRLRGARVEGGAHAFKGAYYAGPAARFMPAPPPASWTGVRDALAWGPSAPQVGTQGGVGIPIAEHCQVLNVWTPAPDNRKRPVMVWLHGGGFQFGSASSSRYDGARLARAQDLVVVSVNHRLGAAGALWLKDLDSRYEASGAVGMLDIVQALAWVRENIGRFGGDPGRVTIFGQSGGGGKVLTLMAMPEARGLFHRAIPQSGSMGQPSGTPADGAKDTARLLAALGLTKADLPKLASMPIDAFLAGQAKVAAADPRHPVHPDLPLTDGLRPFSPVIDGRHLPEQPFAGHAPTASRDVPMMMGLTTKELRRFSRQRPDLFAIDLEGARKALAQGVLGERAGEALAVYRKSRPHASPSELYWAVTTDLMYGAGSIRMAETRDAAGVAPTYMYRFAYDPLEGTPDGKPSGYAAHGAELPFIFDNLDPASPRRAEEAHLRAWMQQTWGEFARTGRPAKDWPAYRRTDRATMMIDADPAVAFDPGRDERLWWAAPGGQTKLKTKG